MIQIIALLLNISIAQSHFLEPTMIDSFIATSGFSETNQYLNCSQSQIINVFEDENGVVIDNALLVSNLTFTDIEAGPIGVPGLLTGFSQRSTVTKEDSDSFTLLTQNRTCEDFVGSLGCFRKKWRTSSSITFTGEGSDLEVHITYHPFADRPSESCVYKR